MRTTSFISEKAMPVQFHLLSFEGPDGYARAGGIASRITGLAQALAKEISMSGMRGQVSRPSLQTRCCMTCRHLLLV